MSWTTAQSEANAALNALEFSNRQIVLRGSGPPNIQGPEGIEYLDESATPHTCYRKTGAGAGDWEIVPPVKIATQAEVDQGTSEETLVTPATLASALNGAIASALAISTPQTDPSDLNLVADDAADGASFRVAIPNGTTGSVVAISLSGYGTNAVLTGIDGGDVGQMVTVRRGEAAPVAINPNAELHLSGPLTLSDSGMLSVITLQRLNASAWIELSRSILS